jgi:hypothetical protein
MNNTYASISNFGPKDVDPGANNPLTYCVNSGTYQQFLHGASSANFGPDCKECQMFMSDYCAQGWDGYCDIAAQNGNISLPNQLLGCGETVPNIYMTQGNILLRNTAARKYLLASNGTKQFRKFDPNVPSSPWIYEIEAPYCDGPLINEYAVNPSLIDDDPVMNRILVNPIIAVDLLLNIYKTMQKYGKLSQLQNTKLGAYFQFSGLKI